jgi:hypothetical protein
VAAIDARNAFPSMDQLTLWLKLFQIGMGGAIFDWLRMLYRQMAYYARHGDMQSAEFKAFIRLLTEKKLHSGRFFASGRPSITTPSGTVAIHHFWVA